MSSDDIIPTRFLSREWVSYLDDDGSEFTQETTWDYPEKLINTDIVKHPVDQIKLRENEPTPVIDEEIQAPLPPNWQRFYNNDGYEYYCNTVTNITTWSIPTVDDTSVKPVVNNDKLIHSEKQPYVLDSIRIPETNKEIKIAEIVSDITTDHQTDNNINQNDSKIETLSNGPPPTKPRKSKEESLDIHTKTTTTTTITPTDVVDITQSVIPIKSINGVITVNNPVIGILQNKKSPITSDVDKPVILKVHNVETPSTLPSSIIQPEKSTVTSSEKSSLTISVQSEKSTVAPSVESEKSSLAPSVQTEKSTVIPSEKSSLTISVQTEKSTVIPSIESEKSSIASSVQPEKSSVVQPEKSSIIQTDNSTVIQTVQPEKSCEAPSEKSEKSSVVQPEKSSVATSEKPQKSSVIQTEKSSVVQPEKSSKIEQEKSSVIQTVQPEKSSVATSEESSIAASEKSSVTTSLPVPWLKFKNDKGIDYYYNPVTKATQWTYPSSSDVVEVKIDLPAPWKLYRNKNGSIYYFNPITKVTSWEPPSIAKSTTEENEEEEIVSITTKESKEDLESNINNETKQDCTSFNNKIIENSIIEHKIIESPSTVINEVKMNSEINNSTPCNYSEIIQSEVSNDSSVKSESKLFKPKASGLKTLLSKLSFAKDNKSKDPETIITNEQQQNVNVEPSNVEISSNQDETHIINTSRLNADMINTIDVNNTNKGPPAKPPKRNSSISGATINMIQQSSSPLPPSGPPPEHAIKKKIPGTNNNSTATIDTTTSAVCSTSITDTMKEKIISQNTENTCKENISSMSWQQKVQDGLYGTATVGHSDVAAIHKGFPAAPTHTPPPPPITMKNNSTTSSSGNPFEDDSSNTLSSSVISSNNSHNIAGYAARPTIPQVVQNNNPFNNNLVSNSNNNRYIPQYEPSLQYSSEKVSPFLSGGAHPKFSNPRYAVGGGPSPVTKTISPLLAAALQGGNNTIHRTNNNYHNTVYEPTAQVVVDHRVVHVVQGLPCTQISSTSTTSDSIVSQTRTTSIHSSSAITTSTSNYLQPPPATITTEVNNNSSNRSSILQIERRPSQDHPRGGGHPLLLEDDTRNSLPISLKKLLRLGIHYEQAKIAISQTSGSYTNAMKIIHQNMLEIIRRDPSGKELWSPRFFVRIKSWLPNVLDEVNKDYRTGYIVAVNYLRITDGSPKGWQLTLRFSQFKDLQSKISKHMKYINMSNLFPNTGLSTMFGGITDQVRNDRMVQLDNWLKEILDNPILMTTYEITEAVTELLEVEGHISD